MSVFWRGVEVGRGWASGDGSFRIPLPVLPDDRLAVVYGAEPPDFGPWVNVGAYISPEPHGTVDANDW